MPKTTKKPIKTVPSFNRIKVLKIALAVASAALLIAVGVYLACAVKRYKYLENDAQVTRMSALLSSAIQNLNGDAPRDPKTGDFYFPEANLYLPSNKTTMPVFAYTYNETDHQLSVTSRNLVNAKTSAFLSSKDLHEVFNKLPEAQACSRGVRVLYTDKSKEEGLTHKGSVSLENGKTAHLFAEGKCDELAPAVEALKTLKSY